MTQVWAGITQHGPDGQSYVAITLIINAQNCCGQCCVYKLLRQNTDPEHGAFFNDTDPDQGVFNDTDPDQGVFNDTNPDQGVFNDTDPDQGVFNDTDPDHAATYTWWVGNCFVANMLQVGSSPAK